jgi:co-chaperonin GroES (HSP10)
MIESKYLERFKRLVENGDIYALRGDRLIVEVLPKVEVKSAGGLIMATPDNQVRGDLANKQPTLAIVLATGSGFTDSEGNPVDLEYGPGAIVMVSQLGLNYFSTFPGISEFTSNTIALTRDSEVHCFWQSAEEFSRYCALLA